jgi:outer membrane lipoprotein-sorting protein
MNKKIIAAFVFFALVAAAASAQDAASIIEQSRNRIKADTVSTRSRMIITAKNGAVSERIMDQYSKKDAQGNARAVIVFQDPASVRGSRFLTMENQGREKDQWIFLPSLGKIRRIAASEGSGSFMGSDFSYDDISSADRKTDLDNHKILRTEKLNGRDCYVIESSSKDQNYQYSKMIQWIDAGSYVIYKIELYDRKGSQVKLLEIPEYRETQGRLAPYQTKMTSLAEGTYTSLIVVNLKYDDPIPESVFTTKFLETGRP